MITKEELTQLINQAKCYLAIASFKYYLNLSNGVNVTKIKKKLNLIKHYIKLLQAFKIVGETEFCNCSVVGDYTVKLTNDSEKTLSPIQFNNNGTGYLIFNNVGYPFEYSYGTTNKIITCQFLTLESSPGNPLIVTFRDIEITNQCNILNITQSPIEQTFTRPDGIPAPGFDGEISILDDNTNPIGTLVIPSEIMEQGYAAIVNYWNENKTLPEDWLGYYNNSEIVWTSPFDGENYFGWGVQYKQYQGIDSVCTFTAPFTTPVTGELFVECTGGPDGDFLIVNTTGTFNTLQEIVNTINSGNTQGIVAEVSDNDIVFRSPEFTYETYNGAEIQLAFTFTNGDPTYDQFEQFIGGVAPTLATFEDFFAPTGEVGEFVNNNPCIPEENAVICLTNEQVEKIVDHLKTLI